MPFTDQSDHLFFKHKISNWLLVLRYIYIYMKAATLLSSMNIARLSLNGCGSLNWVKLLKSICTKLANTRQILLLGLFFFFFLWLRFFYPISWLATFPHMLHEFSVLNDICFGCSVFLLRWLCTGYLKVTAVHSSCKMTLRYHAYWAWNV